MISYIKQIIAMLRWQAWELLKIGAFTERLKLRRIGTFEPLYRPAILPWRQNLLPRT
jgi:hypothetical protein